ncbi:hypothetical protein GWN42_15605 [candidate division KSB1 bacterium]|nr:hypothetical protein [candidate division KSB1 bacterium]NIR70711.1 hypothetical protein [candidate division KSB1 bacterium]NIS27768.1 hypothetical protein [candidate division KSB1 bacterium]NIU28435.1 hypothetical protein [candidate division KSB1 bacterium]NIU91696.1 hypothetical protein [candidate division KSB1 bacterium]
MFLYTIGEPFMSVRHATLTFIRKGASLARVAGEVSFDKGIRLVVGERILYDRLPAVIDCYGYEVWQKGRKLFWYDSQPRPNEPKLQSTHPHHKHVPLSEMSFTRPDLPHLIKEIEALIKAKK